MHVVLLCVMRHTTIISLTWALTQCFVPNSQRQRWLKRYTTSNKIKTYKFGLINATGTKINTWWKVYSLILPVKERFRFKNTLSNYQSCLFSCHLTMGCCHVHNTLTHWPLSDHKRDPSTSVQVMVWCLLATNLYLGHCWHSTDPWLHMPHKATDVTR